MSIQSQAAESAREAARHADGKFGEQTHAEPALRLVSVTADPRWSRLVYEDHPAPEEARQYARIALDDALGDDFGAAFTAEEREIVLEEAERDDRMDEAIDRLGDAIKANPDGYRHQVFGTEIGRLLLDGRAAREHAFRAGMKRVLWTDPDGGEQRKCSVMEWDPESGVMQLDPSDIDEYGHEFGANDWEVSSLERPHWFVQRQEDILESVEGFLPVQSTELYNAALKANFPNVPEQHIEALTGFHKQQPHSWQKRQLAGVAATEERNQAANAVRPEVSFGISPHFKTRPVTRLEESIDALIVAGHDPMDDQWVKALADDTGKGYGTVIIKNVFAKGRLAARRNIQEQS